MKGGLSTGDGTYNIFPDGNETHPVNVYCDMTTDGGGWTLVGKGSRWLNVKQSKVGINDVSAMLTETVVRDLISSSKTDIFKFSSTYNSAGKFFLKDDNPNFSDQYIYGSNNASVDISGTGTNWKTVTNKNISCLPKGFGQHTCGNDGGWILLHNGYTYAPNPVNHPLYIPGTIHYMWFK